MEEETPNRVRLDRWLWAARWYKTRALAARALEGGKVRVNGERPKRARLIGLGDEIRIGRGPLEFHVVGRGLRERPGPDAGAHRAAVAFGPDAAADPERALRALKPGGHIAVEIGYNMRDAVVALLDANWTAVQVIPDLAGIPRVVAAQKWV